MCPIPINHPPCESCAKLCNIVRAQEMSIFHLTTLPNIKRGTVTFPEDPGNPSSFSQINLNLNRNLNLHIAIYQVQIPLSDNTIAKLKSDSCLPEIPTAHLAVCLDNPHLVAIRSTRKAAGKALAKAVGGFYDPLKDLDIPDSLPPDL